MPKQNEVTYNTPPIPRQLRLDTETKCNAKCLSCHRFMGNRNGEMTTELLEKILKDVSHWSEPLTEIIPVNYGEFFMRRDWYYILNMITSYLPKTQITIPTNGSLLNEYVIKELSKIPTLKIINFSANAFFDETYETFTSLPSSNLQKIEYAAKTIKILRPDILTWISMVFSPQYQTDFERDLFISYWKEIVDKVWILSASCAGRGTKPMSPIKLPCRSIFSDIVIGFDGKLSLCCWDSQFSIDLGYYSGDLLKDWANEKITTFRTLHNEHRRSENDLCKVCTSA